MIQQLFATVWKEEKFVILLKSEDKDRMGPRSYRPIRLLNIFGKNIGESDCNKTGEKERS